MRVLIDTTYAHRAPHSGTAVYLERLVEALADEPGVDAVTAQNQRRGAPGGGGLNSARNLLLDHWWAELELPRLARAERADVIHHPLPALTRGPGRARTVVTVHDLAFERLPECFDPRFRRYAHRSHRAAARGASAVICVSETTAADVRELWGVAAGRVVVAPHGPGQALPPLARQAREHFLYVGDAEPRKDLPTLLAAYGRYRTATSEPLPLVIAGGAAASPEAAGPGIRREPSVSPARLAELYARAAALVHPSLYEGFGLTVLEAMRAGVPVIAAEVPGVNEVAGTAARYCPPRSPEAFAAAMAEVTSEPEPELGERGRRQAERFTWAASARAHVAAYSLATA